MAKAKETTQTIETSNVTVEKAVKSLLGQSKGDSIRYNDSGSNNISLETAKLKVQVSIELGRDMDWLRIDELLPVSITKVFDSENITRVIRLPVIQLLLLASNGCFELVNTNPKDKQQFNDLMLAFENGYSYPSSYQASLKKEPFSFASFIGSINLMAESNQLSEQQKEQWALVKSKCPKVKELSDFLGMAYKSPKWVWLAELMDGNGYIEPIVSDDMESLL